jgi:putative SOS response-associated peptidase YedK
MMAAVHNQMPLVLELDDWPVWLDEAEGDPTTLLRPAAEEVLRLSPVSPRVNAPRNNDASLIEPVA